MLLGKITGHTQGSLVDGLEDLTVESFGLVRLVRHSQLHESVGQALDTDTNGPVAHVAVPSLHHRVEVDIDDLVQILGHQLQRHLTARALRLSILWNRREIEAAGTVLLDGRVHVGY